MKNFFVVIVGYVFYFLEIEEKEKEVTEDPIQTVPDIPDDGDILAVTIHRTDKLKNDYHISHPLVRVHIVNEDTGQYLSKQNR